jgi:hypothetical protein
MGELMAAQTPSTQIRRITSLFAGAFILSGLASMGCAAAESAWTPDRKVIEEIEHTVSLPAEAKPIVQYSRYYAGSVRHGIRVVVGTWITGLDVSRIAPSEADLPVIYDGGCGIVNIEYDVKRHCFIRIYCNGVA